MSVALYRIPWMTTTNLDLVDVESAEVRQGVEVELVVPPAG